MAIRLKLKLFALEITIHLSLFIFKYVKMNSSQQDSRHYPDLLVVALHVKVEAYSNSWLKTKVFEILCVLNSFNERWL